MSDNLRRYRAIRNALTQAYPTAPTGNFARHLQTLAALISGIVGSKSTQLPTLATKVPDGTKPESRVKRFARWIDNERILEEMYFLPYADLLLRHCALQTVVLVMDGSVVGRGCNALMIHVVYQGRALPLAWRVRQGPKGHFPEDLHIALVELVTDLPPRSEQVFSYKPLMLLRVLHMRGSRPSAYIMGKLLEPGRDVPNACSMAACRASGAGRRAITVPCTS